MIFLKRLLFKIRGKTPADMEMVKYWKNKDAVQAKVTEEDGVTVMYMEGEKYAFPGFPRGHLLFGPLSKLKHEVKNQVFNESWEMLSKEDSDRLIVEHIRSQALPNVFELLKEHRLDMLPPSKMVPSVREIHRAWTKVAPQSEELRDLVTYILQEDDSYRFRFQWIVSYMPTWAFRFIDPVNAFYKALRWLEWAEVIGDMKERIQLFRTIMCKILKDEHIRKQFTALFREIDWKKVKLTKADKYYFRGKYFKVDLDKFDY